MAKISRKNKQKVAKKKFAPKLKRMDGKTLVNIVWQEGKYYVARCLSIEMSSFGKTKTAALDNLHEALALYFEDEPSVKIIEIKSPSLEIQHV